MEANQKVKILATDISPAVCDLRGLVGVYTGTKGSVRADYTLIQLDGGRAIYCRDDQLEAA